MGKKVKVLCKQATYYGERMRPEGSIIEFDMDHCGTKRVDGKEVRISKLPLWAKLLQPESEERHGEPVQREQNVTTLHQLAEGTKVNLSKPSTAEHAKVITEVPPGPAPDAPVQEVVAPEVKVAEVEVAEVKTEKEEWGIPKVAEEVPVNVN